MQVSGMHPESPQQLQGSYCASVKFKKKTVGGLAAAGLLRGRVRRRPGGDRALRKLVPVAPPRHRRADSHSSGERPRRNGGAKAAEGGGGAEAGGAGGRPGGSEL